MDFSRSSSPLSSLTSTLGNLSNTGSNLTSALSNSINGMFNNKTIYIGLIIVVIVCIGLAWTLYYIISSKIFSLAKVVSNETLKPLLFNQKYKYYLIKFKHNLFIIIIKCSYQLILHYIYKKKLIILLI